MRLLRQWLSNRTARKQAELAELERVRLANAALLQEVDMQMAAERAGPSSSSSHSQGADLVQQAVNTVNAMVYSTALSHDSSTPSSDSSADYSGGGGNFGGGGASGSYE